FDLITAFMICFNNHKMPDLWDVPEWGFFLDDLAKHLTPRGRVWLELNQEYDGSFYTPELKKFFQKRGGRINEQKVIFNSGLQSLTMFFHNGRGGPVNERFISQFFLDRAHFDFDSCNFLVEPLPFPCSIGCGNRQKDLA